MQDTRFFEVRQRLKNKRKRLNEEMYINHLLKKEQEIDALIKTPPEPPGGLHVVVTPNRTFITKPLRQTHPSSSPPTSIVLPTGLYKGKRVMEVFNFDIKYVRWLARYTGKPDGTNYHQPQTYEGMKWIRPEITNEACLLLKGLCISCFDPFPNHTPPSFFCSTCRAKNLAM